MQGPYIVEITKENFDVEVNQSKRPVILDVYADWCDPCKQLTPVLESMVTQARGVVKLGKINSDKQQEISQALGVKSLPTVFGVSKGKLVNKFEGLPEQETLKAFFMQMMQEANASVGPLSVAITQYELILECVEEGQFEEAQALVQAVLTAVEKDVSEQAKELKAKTMAALIRILIGMKKDLQDVPVIAKTIRNLFGKYIAVDEVAQALAAADLLPKADAVVGELKPLSDAVSASPRDPQARFALAQALVSGGDPSGAVEHLLAVVGIDKAWNEGAGRALLLKVFEVLGPAHPVVVAGRKQLAKLLFS